MVLLTDHTSLLISDEHRSQFQGTRRLKRRWNQLSKCQKNIMYTLSVLFLLTVFYLMASSDSSYPVINADESVNDINVGSINNARKSAHIADIAAANDIEHEKVIDVPKHIQSNKVPSSDIRKAKGIQFKDPINQRQLSVINAFKHAWKGYKEYAWGHDNLKPISRQYSDWFGLGLTIVDSIDTIYIMGLKEEYEEAREWIDKHLNFDSNRDVNLFEVTIRVLGGLLSIYHLTGDPMYLNKAIDLGDRLLACFNTDSGIPHSDVNLFTRKAHSPKWSPDSSTSEVTTLQLEFRDLSRITGKSKYEEAVSKVSEHIHKLEKKDGLVPIFINANTGAFRAYATITLGARGDSYYEYLLKQWLQTGKTIEYLKEDFVAGVEGIEKHLVKRTVPNGYVFLGELLVGGHDFKPKMDHLTCYLPGTLALGAHNELPDSHMKLAEELMSTCYQTYAQQPTFLAPEITYFNTQPDYQTDMYVKTSDAHNLLRPEFIESLWYMYQLTGNKTYQEWGWQIFEAFESHTKVTNGYTSIGNVKNAAHVRPKDMMESFFLGETLKYLYLLFSDNRKLIDLDKYIMNSEAHLLPIYSR